jgi:hypothetical protein
MNVDGKTFWITAFLGSTRMPWYGFLFLGVAILIIFPDEALESLRFEYNWRHLIWLEVFLIASIVIAMVLLQPHYPNLKWFYPLIPIALVAIARVFIRMIRGSAEDL